MSRGQRVHPDSPPTAVGPPPHTQWRALESREQLKAELSPNKGEVHWSAGPRQAVCTQTGLRHEDQDLRKEGAGGSRTRAVPGGGLDGQAVAGTQKGSLEVAASRLPAHQAAQQQRPPIPLPGLSPRTAQWPLPQNSCPSFCPGFLWPGAPGQGSPSLRVSGAEGRWGRVNTLCYLSF